MSRRALITGAGRGIGRAIATKLARAGHRVALTDIDFDSYRMYPDENEQTGILDELANAAHPHLHTGVTAGGSEVTVLVAEIIRQWGGLDALICNAGGGSGPLDGNHAARLSIDALQDMLERNLYETVRTVGAALPALELGSDPGIVTMSSLNGVEPTPDGRYAHYGIAKAAVAHYTRYLARDLATQGIRANCLAPGVIATGRLRARMNETHGGNSDLLAPGTGPGGPEDVAAAAAFLVGPEAGYINGQVIRIDGGW